MKLTGPRDLGVRYDQADHERALAKSKLMLDNKPDASPPDSHMVYSGQIPIDETFSGAEITALINYDRSPRFKWSNVQVRFNDDGSAEASGVLNFRGMSLPVYIKGSGDIVSNKSISLSLQDINVANFPITESMKEQGLSFVLGRANDKIQSISGLELGSLELSDGNVHFTGSIPEKAVREKE